MVLVSAVGELAVPNSSPSQFVRIAALGHDKVARCERIFSLFAASNSDGLYLVEIQVSILYIRNTEIGHFNRIGCVYLLFGVQF